MLRPEGCRVKRGVSSFMNCPLPILTDSGGFQVMSLSKLNKVDQEKGLFQLYRWKRMILSPEESIKIKKV